MARAQVQKINTPANSTNVPSLLLQTAALFKVNSSGNIVKDPNGLFLLNPTSWEETKSANWVQQQVPGNSDPILQWLSSGPRMVTFDALVTLDNSDFIKQRAVVANSSSGNFIATIAAKFFSTAAPAPRGDNSNPFSAALLDISGYLNYYRSLLYPLYDNSINPTTVIQSPPLLTLWNGSTFTKNAYSTNNTISSNDDLWVLSNLTIKVTKQLPNLAPLEAIVTFQLLQYTIKPFSASRFNSGISGVGAFTGSDSVGTGNIA